MRSPKQPAKPSSRDWYPYYAGYTEEFVASTIRALGTDLGSVIDPWSGAGTTTAACVRQRIPSVGVDINPALTIIARARLTPRSMAGSLGPLGRQILETAKQSQSSPSLENDLLATWLQPNAMSRIRAVQAAIDTMLVPADGPRFSHIQAYADKLPVLACFFYSVLFAAVRDLMAQFRSSNPMWLKDPPSPKHRLQPSWIGISDAFRSRVDFLSSKLAIDGWEDTPDRTAFLTGTACCLPFGDHTFGAAVTSPPYATRIDYVKGTVLELSVLGARASLVRQLRQQSTGSPVISGGRDRTKVSLYSRSARLLLSQIRNHGSKGSARYYAPWMHGYIVSLQEGLGELSRTVKPEGPIAVVVQDNFYKEIRVDLQDIVIESMEKLDRQLVKRRDFAAPALRSRMNPRARQHLTERVNHESVLLFQ